MAAKLFRAGGMVNDGQDDQIVLHSYVANNNYYSWFSKCPGASAAYSVTSGKYFYMTKLELHTVVSTGGVGGTLAYADNAVAGYNQVSFSPTNFVPVIGGTGAWGFLIPGVSTAGPSLIWSGCLKAIPAAKYPYFWFSLSGANPTMVIITGFEA